METIIILLCIFIGIPVIGALVNDRDTPYRRYDNHITMHTMYKNSIKEEYKKIERRMSRSINVKHNG